MFDARYFAYATISALLVISPGATMAVVLETAIEQGRAAAFATVLGVNIGNSTLALSSALGMAVVFARWPWALEVVKVGGACYLTWLGARGLWRALTNSHAPGTKYQVPSTKYQAPSARRPSSAGSRSSLIARGVATNLLNPPVILFYMTFLPQFISHEDPFFARFLVLAATHISMSLVWLSIYAISIGTLSERMARPSVRRWMAGITGVVLIGFGLRLVLR
jgi:threonine/homoserine/homoserine lactone efflux protein